MCFLALFGLFLQPASAVIIDGSTDLAAITSAQGNGLVDGYDNPQDAIPSSFNVNYLSVGDGPPASSVDRMFSDAGYATVAGQLFLTFVYDAQETNPARPVTIDFVRILVGPAFMTVAWETSETIVLNSNPVDQTLTPLGNGADMALYVPLTAFDGLGLTGSSLFRFETQQSNADNGNDEWIFTDFGVLRDGCDGTVPENCSPLPMFGPDETVSSSPEVVPEPGTVLLLAGGLLAIAALRRR